MRERLPVGRVPAWLLATLPNIALALSGLTGFMGFVRLPGGAIALLVALLFVPAYLSYLGGRTVLPGLIDGYMHFLSSAALVERAARAGFQVTAHAIGTRAIEVLLSAYESLPAGLTAAEDTASTTSSFRLRTRWSARCAWDSPWAARTGFHVAGRAVHLLLPPPALPAGMRATGPQRSRTPAG